MTAARAVSHRGQAGYTLIEVVIASAIGVLVLGSMTSIVMTTVMAANTATSRVEASNQIRGFQLTAYDDFALSQPPTSPGCGTSIGSLCTTQELVLRGKRMPNEAAAAAGAYTATYRWDVAKQVVVRSVAGGMSRSIVSNVSDYTWYVDRSGARPSVVISLTVTVGFYNTKYSQSQTMRFYPRVAA